MAHNQTETASYSATCQVPDDGDVRNAASVNTAFGVLGNRTKWAQTKLGALDGFLAWRGELSAPGGGAVLSYGDIGACVLGDVPYALGAGTKTLAGLGVSTRYYAYAFVNEGVLDIEYSTTVPDSARKFKTGYTSRRYLGTFQTDSSAFIAAFRACNGRYTLEAPVTIVAAGTSTAFADASSTGVPPHARIGYFAATYAETGGPAAGVLRVRTKGDTTVANERQIAALPSSAVMATATCPEFALALDPATQLIQYKVGAASHAATINCVGFHE